MLTSILLSVQQNGIGNSKIMNMVKSLSLAHIVILLSLLLMSCSGNDKLIIQELKPWHSAGDKTFTEEYTTRFMSSLPPRQVQKINRNWTFNYFPIEQFEVSLSESDFDDSKWPAVAIPHSWHNYETTHQEHPFILNASETRKTYFGEEAGMGDVSYWWRGWGWYRKKFSFQKPPISTKRVFIEFEGVMKYCRVYLNNKYLGEHKGGFNAFYFDITDYILPNKENVLVVAVRNKLNDEFHIPPMYSGNQTHSGGIFRDVRIVIKNDVYIPFQGSAEHEGGLLITIPKLSKEKADVFVKTWVKNDKSDIQEIILKNTMLDTDGKILLEKEVSVKVQPGENHCFQQMFTYVRNPKLWSPEDPNLYKVSSEVFVNNKLSDHYESTFGFRTFAWDYEKNIGILNGKPIHIHGTNRTQCFPWLNNAIPEWIDVMDIRDIKFGQAHNFIRPNIHPNNPLIHDLFDQWGMLVNMGAPMIKDIDFDEAVQEQMIREAVRRNRNRPSIVFYSTGNETNDGANSKWIYEEDSTRIIHGRWVRNGQGDFVTHDHTNMDMENLLRVTVRGWTHDEIYSENPKNGQHAGNEEWQHKMARVEGGSQRGRIDMPNGNMWMYCDDGADRVYKNCPLKKVNPKGWVDVYRVPKYIYFLWQANYCEKPMVFIHPHFWQQKYIGQEKDIVVDSNCDEVQLFVNGKKKDKLFPSKENFFTIVFKRITVEQGNITVVAKKGGETIKHTLIMAGKPMKIRLHSSHETIEPGRDAVVMITVDVIDEAGTQVQAFNKDLVWSVKGPAKLLAPEIWQTDINKNSEQSGVWYMATPVSNFIRSIGEPGKIVVKVSSGNLNPAQVEIIAEETQSEKGFLINPRLNNKGRKDVAWKAAFISKVEKENKGGFKYINRDFKLETQKDFSYYKQFFTDVLVKENPHMKNEKLLVDELATKFANHVMKNNGILVADDFNFLVLQINQEEVKSG
ncbi:MAG: DUF4982 domain-containing protein [Bacteroidetes bacterium]|nr:DUF4982 domain-containing protein [Bacteroidota bacterium]